MSGPAPSCRGLSLLPSVFHVADLTIRLGLTPAAASLRLRSWAAEGKVVGLGGRSGVYANLLASTYPDWESALLMIMPSALVIGIEALRRAGWTTQIPYLPTVAVNAGQRVHKVDHFTVEALPNDWFEMIDAGVLESQAGSLPQLAPAWALADLIKREGWCDCGLGPDDIYWDMVSEHDQQDWILACCALGLDLSCAPDLPW